jgi:hypothetical protein
MQIGEQQREGMKRHVGALSVAACSGSWVYAKQAFRYRRETETERNENPSVGAHKALSLRKTVSCSPT